MGRSFTSSAPVRSSRATCCWPGGSCSAWSINRGADGRASVGSSPATQAEKGDGPPHDHEPESEPPPRVLRDDDDVEPGEQGEGAADQAYSECKAPVAAV